MPHSPVVYSYGEPSPFPPSFEGNPWAYGFGLFGDVVAASLALAILTTYLFEMHRHREAQRFLVRSLPMVGGNISLLQAYRGFNIGVLTFVIMRALPDALWMLLWGEVSRPMIQTLILIDLVMDGLALGPLFFGLVYWVWARQAIPQRLATEMKWPHLPRWTRQMVWQNGRIVLVVLLISAGVTLGKASGGG